ncbi:MAG: oxygenase MpaB family protein, partial [Nostocoides sp.]
MNARVLDPVRSQIAKAVRIRVAGTDHSRAERIWQAPGPRWFRPGDPIWRVHCDPSMMVGGLRALLVQSLHPLAMAGVAGHSGFKGDPWGRLQRTSLFIATTTYAPIPDAEALLARIRRIHRRVNGVADDGSAYAANDPHLLAWVHAAEAQSFLTAFQVYAAQPLSPAEADTYVQQIGSVSARLGVVSPPQSARDLDAVVAAYRPELRPSDAALEAAAFLLNDPPLDRLARLGYRP